MKKLISLLCALNLVTQLGCTTTDSQITREVAQVTNGSKDLAIATVGDMSAVDPHFNFLDLNINLSKLVYESLVEQDKDKKIKPLLATSWSQDSKDKTIWRFQLRKDVFFQNGEPFSKGDVLASLDRIMKYEKLSKGGYALILRNVDFVRTTDLNGKDANPHELVLVTKVPAPLFPTSLGSIFIMNQKDCQTAIAIQEQDSEAVHSSQQVLQAFANGSLVNGTGPYRFKEWVPGQHAKVVRNSSYRDSSRTQWDEITLVPTSDAKKRVGLLESKTVQLIASVPRSEMQKLQDGNYVVNRRAGLRNMHMQFAQNPKDEKEKKPSHIPVKDKATGNALPNPLLNRHFRKALNYSVNKNELVREIMQGAGYPTGQYMPAGTIGHINKIGNQYFNENDSEASIMRARLALYEASKELTFLSDREIEIPVHGPNDRYPNDALIVEKLAQIWTKAFHFSMKGKRFSLTFVAHTEPLKTYFVNNATYLISMMGGGVDNGQIEGALRLYFIPGSGLNAGGYNNDKVTDLYKRGISEFDEAGRTQLFQNAMNLVIRDFAFLPLFHVEEAIAHESNLQVEPRVDGLLLGFEVQHK